MIVIFILRHFITKIAIFTNDSLSSLYWDSISCTIETYLVPPTSHGRLSIDYSFSLRRIPLSFPEVAKSNLLIDSIVGSGQNTARHISSYQDLNLLLLLLLLLLFSVVAVSQQEAEGADCLWKDSSASKL